MMRWLLVVLCCLPGPGWADRLYKCVGADGRPAYQSSACAPGMRELWMREVLPETSPPRPAAQVAKSAPAPAASRPAARTPRAKRDPAASRCANARRLAEQRRDRDWNRLTFRQRSELDATVARACTR